MTQKRGGNQKQDPTVYEQIERFCKDSKNFIDKCKKPDKAEYMKILQACVIGFLIMGAIGYFIKLVFIPINNIILS
eukprot:CAMPEP_0170456238 /NCGR_PEP_ID=MMETSP0123-20130129/3942_1 /TAXON_ID=182087 /ORGANISM="Favella ehrenbergii, Strain Fehren 1" /LENGTH=75 /DNA_ID=CAMNT_0010719655 /DNA_START=34 /DNA_END=261 /DNA_ORIENTATION=+